MEFRALKYFLIAAREGSITKAANRLGLTQPNLSRQINILERDIGKKLFTRSNYKIKLTSEGVLLKKRAEEIMDKADIHIVIHDLRTNMKPLLGFSIKSQIGSASTLLNAGMTTNITYKINGASFDDSEIDEINSIESHLERMKAITSRGASFVYHDIDHSVFKNNLLFLDSCMPQFIANCLLEDSLVEMDKTPSIKDCVNEMAKNNPFGFTGCDIEAFYAHKMKVLLLDAALGMTPAKEWTGHYDANGGYLIVRKDGEIVCYHFYNRNDVEDYLYNNTRFERASRSRYKYGSLYRGDDGAIYIKLNLQIRFKK